tara:strand:+ start:71 stop:310 length:240 start_codon:yes stop_codon:yes gene_type:complete
MPQIGWFEILIIVVLSIVIIGPKDFPIVLKKIGKWMSSIKRYFGEIQKTMDDVESNIQEDISFKDNNSNNNNQKKKKDE